MERLTIGKWNIDWKALLVSVAISLGTGVVSALLTMGGMRAYADMYHPPLSPPGWLFPIVWTILYLLMGAAAYLVWDAKKNSEDKRLALMLYGIQLVFNALWSILFFNCSWYFIAFIDLLLLWIFIYLTIKQFLMISKTAGYLLVPYLLWVTFAGYLNLSIALVDRLVPR